MYEEIMRVPPGLGSGNSIIGVNSKVQSNELDDEDRNNNNVHTLFHHSVLI